MLTTAAVCSSQSGWPSFLKAAASIRVENVLHSRATKTFFLGESCYPLRKVWTRQIVTMDSKNDQQNAWASATCSQKLNRFYDYLPHSISSEPSGESVRKQNFDPHSWPRDAKGQNDADDTPEDRQVPCAAHQCPQTLWWESFNPLSGPLRQVFIPEGTRGVWVILGTGDGRHKQNAKVTIVIITIATK